MRPTLTALALILVTALPAAAQPPTNDNATVGGAVETPFRELNIVKDKAGPVLEDAKANPYAHVAPGDCDAMRHQIAELTSLLGPDLDDANFDRRNGSILADAVHSATELPFGGVVERLTGARKEKADRDQAILAGYTRRAYLKGALSACEIIHDGPVHAAANQAPPERPDTVLAAPSNRRALSTHDAAVDAAGGASDIEVAPLSAPPEDPSDPHAGLRPDIPSSDAPPVRPYPDGSTVN
jgi:hypothetical protein